MSELSIYEPLSPEQFEVGDKGVVWIHCDVLQSGRDLVKGICEAKSLNPVWENEFDKRSAQPKHTALVIELLKEDYRKIKIATINQYCTQQLVFVISPIRKLLRLLPIDYKDQLVVSKPSILEIEIEACSPSFTALFWKSWKELNAPDSAFLTAKPNLYQITIVKGKAASVKGIFGYADELNRP